MKVDAIEVVLKNNETLVVHPSLIVGDFAVHNSVFNGQMFSHRWTVTHIPTRTSVYLCITPEDAALIARHLDAKQVIPSDPEAAWEWVKEELRTRALSTELQAIAVYWPLPI